MKEISFFPAKTGIQTCSYDNVSLHSKYDPKKEACTFADNLVVDFLPTLIIVTEPALSYCAEFLRKRFPQTKLVAIRYSKQFDFCNHLWDEVYYQDNLSPLLQNHGEEGILTAFFTAWKPSAIIFPQEHAQVWSTIKTIVNSARSILMTRAFFAQRWIKNTIKFCIRVKNTYTIQKGNSPILIVASGPSLQDSIKEIQKHRCDFFLIALSSALRPLLQNDITPDLCISTDGGYWAKQHIASSPIPLALSGESALYGKDFSQGIVPLSYGDGPEALLLEKCQITTLPAVRNGTVSGTALELALTLTTGPVFACGLDLSSNKGFQHIQPNALELQSSQNDFRLSTKESRQYKAQLSTGSLEIYKNWFKTKSAIFASRFFRINTPPQIASLGTIRDIDWKEYEHITSFFAQNKKAKLQFPTIHPTPLLTHNQRYHKIIETLSLWIQKEIPQEVLEALAPTEMLLAKRSKQQDYTAPQEKGKDILTKLLSDIQVHGNIL